MDDLLVLGKLSTWSQKIEANPFLVWAESVWLEYPDKIQTGDQPEFSWISKVSQIVQWIYLSIRYGPCD